MLKRILFWTAIILISLVVCAVVTLFTSGLPMGMLLTICIMALYGCILMAVLDKRS